MERLPEDTACQQSHSAAVPRLPGGTGRTAVLTLPGAEPILMVCFVSLQIPLDIDIEVTQRHAC